MMRTVSMNDSRLYQNQKRHRRLKLLIATNAQSHTVEATPPPPSLVVGGGYTPSHVP